MQSGDFRMQKCTQALKGGGCSNAKDNCNGGVLARNLTLLNVSASVADRADYLRAMLAKMSARSTFAFAQASL